jgi:hypothetical protein
MRRRTLMRDLVGTLIMFGIVLLFTFGAILAEHWLENFKSH